MRWCLGLFTLLLINLLAAPTAHADIIFVNMNGSTTEIPAAQQAASQLGEKLYVLPSQNISGEKYKTEQLTQDLVRLAKLGVRPRAMVISGHHVKNQGYFGTNGEISLHSILNYTDQSDGEVQQFFASLRSLYLWGCYTGTLTNADRLLMGYNTAFTNTKYVVGFADKAPLSTVPASGQVLKDMLLQESQFRSAAPEQMLELLKQESAKYKDKYDFIVHRGQAFVTIDGYSEVGSFITSCQDQSSRENILQAVLLSWKYYWNQAGPIPDEPGKGPLREAYRQLQRNNFCLQMGAVELRQVEEILSQSRIIRLIYFKNVMQNFARIYGAQLEFANKEMKAIGIEDGDFITQLPQIERGELIKKLEDLNKAIKKALPNFKTDADEKAQYLYFCYILNDIGRIVFPDDEYPTPQSWIDPGATEQSHFQVLNDFNKAKERTRKKALRQLGEG